MKKTKTYSDIFTIFLKSIDLHGETRDVARVLTYDFLKENVDNKDKKVVIIHGIGTGAIKEEVHGVLKRNNHMLKYSLQNNGCTLVEYLSKGEIKR